LSLRLPSPTGGCLASGSPARRGHTPATLSGGIINIHTTQLLSFLEGVGLSCDWKEAAAGRQDMPMEEEEEANLLLSHLIISLREK
jgi:hypothetical protein